MVAWNPEVAHSIKGQLYGIDEEGQFDWSLARCIAPKEFPPEIGDIRDMSQTRMLASACHVLLYLKQEIFLSFDNPNPVMSFSVRDTATHEIAYFRTGTTSAGKATFTNIDYLIRDKILHTDEARYNADIIPGDQLKQFGLEKLKSIIR
jgi:hypothetical protein